MTVKANMPALYRQLKKLPWTRVPAASSVSTDHGRRAHRTIIEAAQQLMTLLGENVVTTSNYNIDTRGSQGVQIGDSNRQVNLFSTQPEIP